MARGPLHAVVAAALAATLFISACGEGPGPPEIGRASSGPITKQRVDEFARAVNLRAEDLPGAAVEAAGPDREASPQTEAALKRCLPEAGDVQMVASVDSPSFGYAASGEIAAFSSSVSAAPTEEEFAAVLERLARPAGFDCLARALRANAKAQGTAEAHYLQFSASKLTKPLPLGAHAVGMRIHIPFEESLVEHDAYIDMILFTAGHAEISLEALGMPKPVSQDVESRLVSTLLERAERHAL